MVNSVPTGYLLKLKMIAFSQICCSRCFVCNPFTIRIIPCNFYEFYGIRAPRKFDERKRHVMHGMSTNVVEWNYPSAARMVRSSTGAERSGYQVREVVNI